MRGIGRETPETYIRHKAISTIWCSMVVMAMHSNYLEKNGDLRESRRAGKVTIFTWDGNGSRIAVFKRRHTKSSS